MAITELLAPAGSPEALDAAVGEGADAVYLGLKNFNARMRSANFTYPQFEGALRSLHRMGRKIYVTVNTVFEQREADRVYQLLKYLAGLGPDGILVQDFGIVTMARENFPSLKLHASTQMNVESARGVNLLSRRGFSRVVLARELSLDEIRAIRANTNMELEVFIHGALCMSVSGICLFSGFLGGKSANRGMCTQACRRYYTAHVGRGPEAESGENGGYYFSPSDLELISEIPELVKAGVNSFKIEGRMKSAEYVGTVVSAYRLVMDNLEAGEANLSRALTEARALLKNDFARAKTNYLINGITGLDWLNPNQNGSTGIPGNTGLDWLNPNQNGGTGIPGNTGLDWLNPKQNGGTGIPLGKLLSVSSRTGRGGERESQGVIPAGLLALSVGDSIRLHKADDSDRVSHKLALAEETPEGNVRISLPEGFAAGDSVYLIQTKAMTRRYAPVIPRNLESFKRGPGRESAPMPGAAARAAEKGAVGKKGKAPNGTGTKPASKTQRQKQGELSPGFYAMVSRIEDLYALQSVKPEKAILTYSKKVIQQLLGNKALPFPPGETIIFLDPFFPQAREAELSEDISALLDRGYSFFIVNNLGHFSLFRRMAESRGSPANAPEAVSLIAGPWLYAFNAWAWNFLENCGASYCVSPLENNRQNLERGFPRTGPGRRSQVFITVYGRPSLFRIRQDLARIYDFSGFSGNRGEDFLLGSGPEGALVHPMAPFSIVDKTPFLREAGFGRFILDFSSAPLKKAEYRDIMAAAARAVPLPGASRFNWKNGFYNADKITQA